MYTVQPSSLKLIDKINCNWFFECFFLKIKSYDIKEPVFGRYYSKIDKHFPKLLQGE